MGVLKVTDNAATTLAAPLTNNVSVTSMILTNAAKFPIVNHGGTGTDWSYFTLFDAAGNIETVKVTRRDSGSNTVTIVRGSAAGIYGVTDASCLAWASGTTGVACRLIAQTVNDAFVAAVVAQNEAIDAAAAAAQAEISAAAAAASAAIVATLDAATIIHKTSDTGAAILPAGTTAQRPTADAGLLRFNTQLGRYEGANGSSWGSLGGATGGGNDDVFYENSQTVTADYTITAGKNAMSAGPITISDGVSVTIPNGSVWTVV